jgi:hypothetical protein
MSDAKSSHDTEWVMELHKKPKIISLFICNLFFDLSSYNDFPIFFFYVIFHLGRVFHMKIKEMITFFKFF